MAAGIPAEAVSGETPDDERAAACRRLASRQTLVLVNCDLFGEGFDLPAIETVIMGTKTASLARYLQWFGRGLRPMLTAAEWAGYDDLTPEQRRARIAGSAKPSALIIDHGGNLVDHNGGASAPRTWSLDRTRGQRASDGPGIDPYRICANPDRGDGLPCCAPYERALPACPHCGHAPVPAQRREPQHVDGQLSLLDPEALQALYARMAAAQETPGAARERFARAGLPAPAIGRNVRQVSERREALEALRQAMADWGGWRLAAGDDDHTMQRRFFLRYGVDVLSAQALGAADARALAARIALDATGERV